MDKCLDLVKLFQAFWVGSRKTTKCRHLYPTTKYSQNLSIYENKFDKIQPKFYQTGLISAGAGGETIGSSWNLQWVKVHQITKTSIRSFLPGIRYTTLHYTTLHYTTRHYTTLHYTTLHYTTGKLPVYMAVAGLVLPRPPHLLPHHGHRVRHVPRRLQAGWLYQKEREQTKANKKDWLF